MLFDTRRSDGCAEVAGLISWKTYTAELAVSAMCRWRRGGRGGAGWVGAMVVSGWSISGWLRVGSLTVRPESEIPCVAVPLGWCSVCGMVTVRDPLSDSPFGQVLMLVSGGDSTCRDGAWWGGALSREGDHTGVGCVAQRDSCVVSGSVQVMVTPGSSRTSPMVHRSLCPIARFGQVTACLLTATTDFRADAAMNVMFCVPGTFLTAGLACGYTRL